MLAKRIATGKRDTRGTDPNSKALLVGSMFETTVKKVFKRTVPGQYQNVLSTLLELISSENTRLAECNAVLSIKLIAEKRPYPRQATGRSIVCT